MTDSYHFQIEPEPRAEVAKFRIGGVYRAVNGCVYQLCAISPTNKYAMEKYEGKMVGWAKGADDGWGFGFRSLVDGCDMEPEGLPAEVGCRDLIPGELVQRDGQWVAADSIGPFPSGATLKVAGDKIVGRVEAEAEPVTLGAILRRALDRLVVPAPAPEPIRPALDWNTATPFDPFGADFIVTKGEVPTAPLHTSPTTDSAYPAIAGLLRG